MKIISLEGLDKSGKKSQCDLLETALTDAGFTVARSEFHRYDTPTGALIMQWLTKEWDVDQQTIELIMTADKQAQQAWFQELEDAGTDFLILDRYTLSQEAYSIAQGIDIRWEKSLMKNLRRPDVELFIDIPAEVSMRRKGKHNGGENDRYESDLALLQRVRDVYRSRKLPTVDGTQSPQQVHVDLVAVLAQKIHPLLEALFTTPLK